MEQTYENNCIIFFCMHYKNISNFRFKIKIQDNENLLLCSEPQSFQGSLTSQQ